MIFSMVLIEKCFCDRVGDKMVFTMWLVIAVAIIVPVVAYLLNNKD